MVFDIFWGAHGLLLASPGLLWVGFGGVLGVFVVFLLLFRRGLRSENFETLENDDSLNEIQIDPETIK